MVELHCTTSAHRRNAFSNCETQHLFHSDLESSSHSWNTLMLLYLQKKKCIPVVSLLETTCRWCRFTMFWSRFLVCILEVKAVWKDSGWETTSKEAVNFCYNACCIFNEVNFRYFSIQRSARSS